MGKQYSETPPAFAKDVGAVILVVEGLVLTDTPWNRAIVPERLAAALREIGIRVSLHALGTRDSLALVKQIAEVDEASGVRALEVLDQLELSWAVQTDLHARAGLRELVLHLSASGKKVLFVSGMAEYVARQVVASSLRLRATVPVYGRRSPAGTSDAIIASLSEAVKSLQPDASYAVLAHASMSEHVPADTGGQLHVLGKEEKSVAAPPLDVIDLAAECELTTAERIDIEKRVRRRNRAQELRAQSSLSNAQMAELAELAGGVQHISNSAQYGYLDVTIGFQNVQLMEQIRTTAAHSQHLLEVVSIDATLIEVQLRNWLIVHRNHSFDPNVRMTFGQTVDLAAEQGFPSFLVDRLRIFNAMRNSAVHHLARGAKSYYDMTDEYMADCALLFDVEDFVADSAPVYGRPSEDY